jgi:hypothetical protein
MTLASLSFCRSRASASSTSASEDRSLGDDADGETMRGATAATG